MVAWCFGNYLASDVLLGLSVSLPLEIHRGESRRPRARLLSGDLSRRAASLSDHTRDYCWHGITNVTSRSWNTGGRGRREYPANTPRLEELPARAAQRITRHVRIRDTDWQVFPRARENRSRVIRAPLPAAPRGSTGQSRPSRMLHVQFLRISLSPSIADTARGSSKCTTRAQLRFLHFSQSVILPARQ